VSANLHGNPYFLTGMVVNPNVEGDIWLADGNTVYHSVDSGATWARLKASNTYKIANTNTYITLVEAISPKGRYFRIWKNAPKVRVDDYIKLPYRLDLITAKGNDPVSALCR
jgi:hypothetical protein